MYNKEALMKWADWLEANPDKQGYDCINYAGKVCALGGLLKAYLSDYDYTSTLTATHTFTSLEFIDWFGGSVLDLNGGECFNDRLKPEFRVISEQMNDRENCTFPEIANHIRRTLIKE